MHNKTGLGDAVALGAGDPIEDISDFFAIAPKHRARFGQALRMRSEGVLELMAQADFDERYAGVLVDVIAAIIAHDPVLSHDAREMLTNWYDAS